MKDILIISNYYPPEIGAAANRICHLAEGLNSLNYNVSVVAPLPNYPRGKIFNNYKGKFILKLENNGIKIYRLWLLPSNSKSKIKRIIAMVSFSFSLTWFFLFHRIPKTVIVQSPPLLVAFTSILFLRSKKRTLVLNISDLWPLAGLKLGALKKNFGFKVLEKIERFNYKNATLIMGQSNEILRHVATINSKAKIFLYRNYPDFNVETLEQHTSSEKIKLVYAGLLGVAQGVLELCKRLDYSKIELHLYGAGAELESIKIFIENNKTLPITFHGELNREQLHKEIINYDIAIIPLRNRIYGSVPSKIFEYAKLGLPILYFGGGEGEKIISANGLGWIAPAGNFFALNQLIDSLTFQEINMVRQSIKVTADKYFDFSTQLQRLEDFLT